MVSYYVLILYYTNNQYNQNSNYLYNNISRYFKQNVMNVKYIKRNLYNRHRQIQPKLPSSNEEVLETLDNIDLNTIKNKNY